MAFESPSSPALARTAEVERLLRRSEVLRRIIEEISGQLELRPLLTKIVRAACELLGADDGTIGLLDERKGVIRIEAIYQMPAAELGAEMAPGVGLAGQVLVERKPVILERYGQVAEPTLPDLAAHAVVGMPIFWGPRLVGFFGLGAKPPRVFSSGDVETLALFARHVAIAIENARRFEREQLRTERLERIAHIGQIIAGDLALEDLLVGAAEAIHNHLGYQNVAIPLVDPEDPGTLLIEATGGSYRELVTQVFRQPVGEGIMGAAVTEKRLQLVNDVRADPRYVPTPGSQGIRSELAVPILLGGEVLGVLNVEGSEAFEAEDAASLRIVADHLAVAINNAQLFERSQKAATLEERQRLARELHDSVTQLLFSATMIAESIIPAYRRSTEEGEARVTRILELNRSAHAEMRALLEELRPDTGEVPLASGEFPLPASVRVRRFGLIKILGEEAKNLKRDGLTVSLDGERYQPQTVRLEETLHRVAQEALTNVKKHAQTDQAWVMAEVAEDRVVLTVEDRGRGFDARAALNRRSASSKSGTGGLGLLGIRERVRSAAGRLRIVGEPGHGTRVEVELPRKDRESSNLGSVSPGRS